MPSVRMGTVAELQTEGAAMLQAHRDDPETLDSGPIDPNWDSFYNLELAGNLIILLARIRDELVGYAVNVVFWDLYNQENKILENVGIFVFKEHRTTGAGIRLIREVEHQSIQRACVLTRWNTVKDTHLMELLIVRGYTAEFSALSRPNEV